MNQGIEILLARRKTHPKEFVPALDRFELMRWSGLFRDYKVNLNDARTYPTGKKGESFTEAVMRELLDESDMDTIRAEEYTRELAKSMQKTKEAMSAHLLWSMYENK